MVQFSAGPVAYFSAGVDTTLRVGRDRTKGNWLRRGIALRGWTADGVASAVLTLHPTTDPAGRIRLARRLRARGFSLQQRDDAKRTRVVIMPPMSYPVPAIGQGPLVRLYSAAGVLPDVVEADFGSTIGLPIR